MKLAYEMTYLHPVTETTCIKLVPYISRYQEQYKDIYNACYHEMREALEIKPYDFIQDNSFFDEGMENVYLLIEQGEIIGSNVLIQKVKKSPIKYELIDNKQFDVNSELRKYKKES